MYELHALIWKTLIYTRYSCSERRVLVLSEKLDLRALEFQEEVVDGVGDMRHL